MLKKMNLLLGVWCFCLCFTAVADTVDDNKTYCLKAGGVVQDMAATFATSHGEVIGFSKRFCTFMPVNGYIAIGLDTFASDMPSIAATYIKILPEITGNSSLFKGSAQNPSYNVCRNLGGTMIGFVVRGGFVDEKGASDICVFGDGSMVSGWSLIYMANHREGYDQVKEQVKAQPLEMKVS